MRSLDCMHEVGLTGTRLVTRLQHKPRAPTSRSYERVPEMLPEKPLDFSPTPTSMNHMPHDEGNVDGSDEPGWKHWGLMILCCLAMIAIAHSISDQA